MQQPLLEFLSVVVKEFNRTYRAAFTDPEYIIEAIREIPEKVDRDPDYSNAERQNVGIENNERRCRPSRSGAHGPSGAFVPPT